jgi:hypothetical protein
MLSVLLSLAWLVALSAFGVAFVTRLVPILRPLERVAYGATLGMVIGTLALVPLATFLGFGAGVVVLDGLLAVLAAAWLCLRVGEGASFTRIRSMRPSFGGSIDLLRRAGIAPVVVIGALAVRWAFYWRSALTNEASGLWAGHINIWGDWTVHLGVVSSFLYGANFPPEHPRFAGHPFSYHYLADLTSAGMAALGMDPGGALSLHSWIGSVLVLLALYAFARRLTGNRGAATLAVVLFVLGGGLAWFATVIKIEASHDLVGTLLEEPWERNINRLYNIWWVNMFFGFLASQRAFLYGLPMAMAILTTLLVGTRTRDVRLFAAAGLIAGFLPLAHLATLLALAIVIPVLFLFFPQRGWILFGIVWVAVAVPQLLVQQGGGPGALSAFRWQLGWVSEDDQWFWFWLKNLGWFLPLLVIGFFSRGLMPERSRRFLAGFMAVFAVGNVAVFQPWDWDNHKILVYFFLAGTIVVAALLARAWRESRSVAVRVLVGVTVLSLVLSGVLEDFNQWQGKSRFIMLEAEEIQLAELVRESTPARSLFITGMENHDPIATLAGRRLLVGYDGWLWTEGIPYGDRQADVRAIYRFGTEAPALLAAHGVDYVLIGPHELENLSANEDEFAARYPIAVETANYRVYDVREGE